MPTGTRSKGEPTEESTNDDHDSRSSVAELPQTTRDPGRKKLPSRAPTDTLSLVHTTPNPKRPGRRKSPRPISREFSLEWRFSLEWSRNHGRMNERRPHDRACNKASDATPSRDPEREGGIGCGYKPLFEEKEPGFHSKKRSSSTRKRAWETPRVAPEAVWRSHDGGLSKAPSQEENSGAKTSCH